MHTAATHQPEQTPDDEAPNALLLAVSAVRRGGGRHYLKSVQVPVSMAGRVDEILAALCAERERHHLKNTPGVLSRLAG